MNNPPTDFKCEPIILTPEELQEVFRTAKPTPELEGVGGFEEPHYIGQTKPY